MTVLTSHFSLAPTITEYVGTTVDIHCPITPNIEMPRYTMHVDRPTRIRGSDPWQEILNKLDSWIMNPSQLEDEGVDAPSKLIIFRAVSFLKAMQRDELLTPTSVVPDGSGGIVVERCQENGAEIIHFWDDGHIDYQKFSGNRLVARQRLA